MKMKRDIPQWLLELENSDIEFIRNFIVNSGSLKDLAKQYDISYPTVRIRLNNLIQKIEVSERQDVEPMISFLKKLAIDNRLSLETAELIINKYNQERSEE
ncbi:DUF2089 family protein [Staphylococcus gallinarum]|uniref:DUF2089 family protein n=2 Tax=Staphylococcus gallinarum TaxID=1293 RepID=A0A418HK70_STAGA|nr:DUF2089 family protein [Staphylococcus gallinarum]MCD8827223.1 DUF2089 domain-containing protein [Staphylococcus gallinarum]RIL40975.1 DUF2089 family protein [Staphylococcus gallinarum]RIO92894.1 DUF2089 family protein [Staphylococcus gallinarum]